MLRSIIDVPLSSRTERLSELTASIDGHSHRDEIRSAFREFWSHHSYVRVISEAGLPDQIFLLRELFSRTVKRLLPEDEVRGDLYVLLDSLGLKESVPRHESHTSFIASGSHFTTAPRSRLRLLSNAAPAARKPKTASSTTDFRERTASKKFLK